MDYEKMYNDLKADHVTLQNQFDTYKEDNETKITELETKISENQTLLSEKDTKIGELNETNMNLYLRIPQQQNNQSSSQNEKSFDDILKEIGGSI